MAKAEYRMNPLPVEFINKDPKLAAKFISFLIDYVKACDKARDRLNDGLKTLALPICREAEKLE
jgi:hypothetical protein